jgi:hypothetical protein
MFFSGDLHPGGAFFAKKDSGWMLLLRKTKYLQVKARKLA